MSQLNTTPEGFRTAAYLAARARLDAARSRSGKTSRSVACNPPNVRCGGRCIPPAWDCRLKGEGPDPHLRAVKTDPLSGFANIQRGIGRITKGVTRGNLSEVQGGRAAIIRGVVKTVPGDIQQKKQLKQTLENRTRAIGLGLAVVTTGLGMHAILMKSNLYGYRQGWGKDINQATRAGVSRVLDSLPVLGTQRRATQAGVRASVEAAAARASAPAMSNSAIPGTTVLSATNRESQSDLNTSLKAVDLAARTASGTSGNLENWNQRHKEAFWSADRSHDLSLKNAKGVSIDRISIYAEPTAQEYLGNQFGVPASERTSRSGIKAAMQSRLAEERSGLVALAKQQGFRTIRTSKGDVINPDDVNLFVRGVMRNNPIADTAVRQRVEEHVRSVLKDSPSTYTDKLYNASVVSFDTFYKETSAGLANIPGAAATGRRSVEPLTAGSNELLRNTNTYRSTYLAGELRARTQMAGPAHAELVQAAYYHTKVIPRLRGPGASASPYTITDRLALNAASELSGRSITSRSEAIGIINRETGFSGARVAAAAAPRQRGASAQASLSTLARSIMARAGNENMSMEAALRQARAEIARRGDSADIPPRVAAYLQRRTDAAGEKGLGKPCGASHIPKAYECSKGAAGSSSAGNNKTAIIAAVVGGAVAIGVAGAVAYNVKTISDPTKTPLAASPNIRDVVKAAKAETGTKSASEAMGHYYVNKSGLKPGDVVYFRTAKDPSAHFGVYLGPGKDGVVRAVIANTKASRFSWADVMEIGATKPGVKTAQATMPPLVKAPTPQFLQGGKGPYTSEEVVRRAIRISSTDYKFSVTRNNCETLANTIAYGVPKSEQLDRFNRASRVMVDVTVGRGQRGEGERAIYEGRAQGRNYTASDFSKFLEGERAFSSPEGKNLARQYDTYFKGYNLDARNAPDYLGLISPSELWSSISTYEAPVRAQAMSNYLFALRTLKEMAAS